MIYSYIIEAVAFLIKLNSQNLVNNDPSYLNLERERKKGGP